MAEEEQQDAARAAAAAALVAAAAGEEPARGGPAAAAEEEPEPQQDGGEAEWPTSAGRYTLEAEIGAGAFATVYRATCERGGGAPETCAIKILDLDELNVNWDETRREINIMRGLRHPNVVPVLQAFVEEEELWIVMPLLEGGSCANIMKETCAKGIKSDAVLARILQETLKGLAYLHASGHIHRDIKASNILVSARGEVMIGDFGVAGTLLENGDRRSHRTTFTGTPCWMAPEVMEERGYDYKADIWSLGITALELAYGRAPYANYQPMKVLMLTLQEDPPTAAIYKDSSYKFSSKLSSLVEKCLRKESAKRAPAAKLLEHKFLRKACDADQLAEQLVRPLKPLGQGAAPIPRRKKDRKDQNKRKPISVGSWVFDVAELRRQAAEEEAKAKAEGDDGAGADAAAGAPALGTGPAAAAPADESSAGDSSSAAASPVPADEAQQQQQPQQPQQPQSEAADAAPRTVGRFTVTD